MREVAFHPGRHAGCADLITDARRGLRVLFTVSDSALGRAHRRRPICGWARLGRHKRGVHKVQEMRERRAEVRAVDGLVTGGVRGVDVIAAAAVELHGIFEWGVDEADGEEGLTVAQYPRAVAEVATLILFDLRKKRRW